MTQEKKKAHLFGLFPGDHNIFHLGVLVGGSKGVWKEISHWRLPEGGQTKTHNEPENVKLKRKTSKMWQWTPES